MTTSRSGQVVMERADREREHVAGQACWCRPTPCLRSVDGGRVLYLHTDSGPFRVRRVDPTGLEAGRLAPKWDVPRRWS